MDDESALSPWKREGAALGSQGFYAQQNSRARALGNGVVLGVVTVLHLSLMVYLTIPPTPMNESRIPLAKEDVGALKVQFVDATPRFVKLPASNGLAGIAHAGPRSAVHTIRPRNTSLIANASVPAVPSESPSGDQGADTQAVAPTPGNPGTAYGNPLLRDGPGRHSAADDSRLPGVPDHAFVRTIALSESPSPEQIVKDTGQYMNCSQVRIARFFSASEMDKRHITTQQLDQAFTEFGCK